MVQIIDEAPGFAAGLGQGVARGLSEQLPKEIERYRLSQGLKNLEQRSQGMTPFQQASELYGIPGSSPQLVQALLPLLQQQQGNLEARRAAGMQQGSLPRGQQPPRGEEREQPSIENELIGGKELIPLSERRNTSTYLTPTPDEQIRRMAVQLQSLQPNRFRTVSEAEQEISSRDQKRLAREQAFENRQDLVAKEFDSVLKKKLQKEGNETYVDILGDLQDDFKTRAENAVANGEMTPRQAAKKFGNEALDFAKQRQIIKSKTYWDFLLKPFSGEQNRHKLESIGKKYRDLGQSEAFKNDLIAYKDLTAPYANFIAFPVSSQEKRVINALPGGAERLLSKKTPKNLNADIATKIADNIQDSDSLQSIALALRHKGYKESEIMDELRLKWNENAIKLNERQARELSERTNLTPSLQDIYFLKSAGISKILGES